MFENPGLKIKTTARWLFPLGLIATLILAIVFANVEEQIGLYYSDTVFHAEIFLAIMAGGSVTTYIQCLCMYGFGELIENSKNANGISNTGSALKDIESNLPLM